MPQEMSSLSIIDQKSNTHTDAVLHTIPFQFADDCCWVAKKKVSSYHKSFSAYPSTSKYSTLMKISLWRAIAFITLALTNKIQNSTVQYPLRNFSHTSRVDKQTNHVHVSRSYHFSWCIVAPLSLPLSVYGTINRRACGCSLPVCHHLILSYYIIRKGVTVSLFLFEASLTSSCRGLPACRYLPIYNCLNVGRCLCDLPINSNSAIAENIGWVSRNIPSMRRKGFSPYSLASRTHDQTIHQSIQ